MLAICGGYGWQRVDVDAGEGTETLSAHQLLRPVVSYDATVCEFTTTPLPAVLVNTVHARLTEGAKKFVAEKGFDPQFGARPLHRAIQKYIEDPLAEFILGENPPEGSVFKAVLRKDGEGLNITIAKEAKSETKK